VLFLDCAGVRALRIAARFAPGGLPGHHLCVPRIPSMALTSRVALPESGRDDHRSCPCGSSSS
jgi:hypothetical protein